MWKDTLFIGLTGEEGVVDVRPAAHFSNRCKSGGRPVVGRTFRLPENGFAPTRISSRAVCGSGR